MSVLEEQDTSQLHVHPVPLGRRWWIVLYFPLRPEKPPVSSGVLESTNWALRGKATFRRNKHRSVDTSRALFFRLLIVGVRWSARQPPTASHVLSTAPMPPPGSTMARKPRLNPIFTRARTFCSRPRTRESPFPRYSGVQARRNRVTP